MTISEESVTLTCLSHFYLFQNRCCVGSATSGQVDINEQFCTLYKHLQTSVSILRCCGFFPLLTPKKYISLKTGCFCCKARACSQCFSAAVTFLLSSLGEVLSSLGEVLW